MEITRQNKRETGFTRTYFPKTWWGVEWAASTGVYTRMLGVQIPCAPCHFISNFLEDCNEYFKK